MLNIDEIQNGIVIDHIKAGTAMGLMDLLGIKGNRTANVALIQNARSHKAECGRKDIIKIEGPMENIDLDILGYIDHNITVNIIRGDHIVEKKALKLPQKITNVIRCKNPRCITSIEQELPDVFYLADEKTETYRCMYCEEKYNKNV